jgi:hypothetical protein
MYYAKRRPHLHSRRQTLQLSMETEPIDLWFPPVEEPIVIDDFAAASSVAFCMTDAPVDEAALILLDEQRQITAILFDPPLGAALCPGMIEGPGFEVEFCNTMFVQIVDHDINGQPAPYSRTLYETIRRWHAVQGLLLLDVIQVNGDDVRSLSIAFDRDSVWFEPFSPLRDTVGDGDNTSQRGIDADHEAA